jgi:anti-anti-sigma factor
MINGGPGIMQIVYLEQVGKTMLARIEAKRLTADVAHQTFEEVFQSVGGTERLVVDLREIDFMDSTAIGELVILGKKLRANGVAYTIVGLKPHLMSLVKMMRLDKVMTFSENADSAIPMSENPKP